jgi:hypothetical protein
MIEDFFFLRKNVVDVDAAIVGISKTRWVALPHMEASIDRAQEIMQQQQFDLLPIITKDGIVCEYFQTADWNNYDKIQRKEIDYDDIIPLQTPLRTVIKSFAKEKRLFYFLTNENRVSGLISVVHLNKRQVRILIFSLISELEIRLSSLIRLRMREEEILKMVGNKDVKQRYSEDKEHGIESDLMEYLYFSDLISIIAKNDLYKILGYPSRKKFENALGPINNLRNEVVHPTRSLIARAKSVGKLWDKLETIERNLFRLRQCDDKTTRVVSI